MRKTLAEEFSAIYVLNLRGNQRTAGEQSRKEGGKIFGGGSRATVAITLLVQRSRARPGPATIHYTDIGDYLTAEQKLAKVAAAGRCHGPRTSRRRSRRTSTATGSTSGAMTSQHFVPSARRTDIFVASYASGLKTNRDAWVYDSRR